MFILNVFCCGKSGLPSNSCRFVTFEHSRLSNYSKSGEASHHWTLYWKKEIIKPILKRYAPQERLNFKCQKNIYEKKNAHLIIHCRYLWQKSIEMKFKWQTTAPICLRLSQYQLPWYHSIRKNTEKTFLRLKRPLYFLSIAFLFELEDITEWNKYFHESIYWLNNY